MSWKEAETITSVFVHGTVFLAFIAGVIKFKLLHVSRRYKSELECRHHVLPDGQIVFEADYIVTNTGERPIDFISVSLHLCAAELRDDGLLSRDPGRSFARRVINNNPKQRNFHLEAGERSTFTLRTMLTSLDAVTFVLCQLSWKGKCPPAPYNGLYVRADVAIGVPQHSTDVKGASASR
jgi:hypothetical protein